MALWFLSSQASGVVPNSGCWFIEHHSFPPATRLARKGWIAATAQQLMDGLFRGSRLVVLHFDKSCLTTEAWWQGLLTLCPELSEVRERLP